MLGSASPQRSLGNDLRGVSQLAIDAVVGVTGLVEHLTANILHAPSVLGTPIHSPTGGVFGLAYRSICGITQGVGNGLDSILSQLTPFLPAVESSEQRETFVAILNGVLGHHLEATRNPLRITMAVRHEARTLPSGTPALAAAIPKASGKLLVCVHGLCMNDIHWQHQGHDHGARLAATDHTPLYVRYNTGLHISINGRELAAQLEALVAHWPVPVESITLLGHSMGGLVSRSACHYGQHAGHRWVSHLEKMIFLGTPHHGSPLERGGNRIDRALGRSPYTFAFSRLGKIRSAGITDLRHGTVLDEDWADIDRFARSRGPTQALALPEKVRCYAIGGTLAKKGRGAVNETLGDGLVPLSSALGHHTDAAKRLNIPRERCWIAYQTGHIGLLGSKAVYDRLESWLAEP